MRDSNDCVLFENGLDPYLDDFVSTDMPDNLRHDLGGCRRCRTLVRLKTLLRTALRRSPIFAAPPELSARIRLRLLGEPGAANSVPDQRSD